jgi:hypothetical protein
MIGRIVGFVAGAAIAATGYGMLKPAMFARYVDFSRLSLGPFAEYKTIVCWLIVAAGLVVALASLQRPAGTGRKKAAPVEFGPAETGRAPAHGHGPLNLGPDPDEAESHDEHPADHREVHSPEPAH